MEFSGRGIWLGMMVGLMVMVMVMVVPFVALGDTDPRDVVAINNLYISLGSPLLLGWLPIGGDPCGERWQGVDCVFSNITGIGLSGMNLVGSLTDSLGDFQSIISMDLSNNHIGGSIPLNLPPTIRNFSLSGNQLNGSIPVTLFLLSELLELSLSNNLLSGAIPNAFQPVSSLTMLDLSGNNLTEQLPPSMASLSSLKALYLQNNKLTGLLDVLQDLSLLDLDIGYNLFSGPIPEKLLSIPDFRKDGNPFNTTLILSPPVAFGPSVARPPSMYSPPSSEGEHAKQVNGPSSPVNKFSTTKKLVLVAVSGLIAIGVCVSVWRCCRGRRYSRKHDIETYKDATDEKSTLPPTYKMENAPREPVMKPFSGYQVESKRTGSSRDEEVVDVTRWPASLKREKDHEIDMSGGGGASMNLKLVRPPAPPPVEEAATKRRVPTEVTCSSSRSSSNVVSLFSIASLQQYTDGFSEEHIIGEGLLGSVYRAELPDGKLLTVKKLESLTMKQQNDDNFVGLVSGISELKHPNILELVGYCNEHDQRLLVYEYGGNVTLHDALHIDDEIHEKLSWNARVRVALEASKALQYLHEVCQPPVVHRSFKSDNVFLDEKLVVRVSDCGLGPLLSSTSTNQLSGYDAPEIELGSHTCQSDVYNLGVVMLELLTGRKSYDRSRPRGEHFLARWAINRLHDIDALSKMVDPALKGTYPIKSLSRFADIISRCVQSEPGFRPPISEVVQDLLHTI